VWSELEEIVNGVRAPLPAIDVERAVAGVMRRIEREPRVEARQPQRRAAPALLAVSFAAAAGIAVVLSMVHTAPSEANRAAHEADVPSESASMFASRGGGPLSLRQAVSVTFRRESGAALPPVAPGETVAKTTQVTVSYRNVREHEPAYLLAFAIDSGHVVHWLFPAFERAGEDPASVLLAPSPSESPMGTSVVFDDPESGPVRFVSIVSSSPHHVSDIELLSPDELSPDALRARFRDDVVEEIPAFFP
jgi:hypothetical protein